jgi:uncharacterized membrane protein
MIVLLGVLVVVVGFVTRRHPLLVILAAALITSIASGLDVVAAISALGKAFAQNRTMAVGWLVLPVVGILERAGLKERAQELVRSIRAATPSRILLAYFALRQVASALGLTSLGGHAQMVRPLVAPMAEASAERMVGTEKLTKLQRFHVRAHAAAADNIALFFGEDIFVAIGSILLMKGFLAQNGYEIEALDFAVWAIPTAVLAFVIHGTRIVRLDRHLRREEKEPNGS